MNMELREKKVMVMGLGLNDGGLGAVEYAINQQVSELIITDSRTADILDETIQKINALPSHTVPIRYILGEQKNEDYTNIDIIIKNPGVPHNSSYLKVAREAGVEITTDVELFFSHIHTLDNPPVTIGITGTRGKSTTTALIHHILSEYYGEDRVLMGGNIRKSILRLINEIHKDSYVVLELSSFQLDTIRYSPHIGVFTSFFPDHLDRYDSLEAYFESKTHIVKFQSNTDIAVLNIDNDRIAELASNLNSRVMTYSLHNKQAQIYIDNETIIYQGDPVMSIHDIPIRGEHNRYNVMAAIQVSLMVNIPIDTIVQAITTFKGVEGRQQSLGMIHGVEIINDTTSTMPVALGVALDTFKDTPYIVICGGEDKGLDYSGLSAHIHPNLKGLVLLPGSGSDLIRQYMSEVTIYDVSSLDEAVDKALSLTQSGEKIIFSPGATSFGMFLNEFDRGDKFVEAINKRK